MTTDTILTALLIALGIRTSMTIHIMAVLTILHRPGTAILQRMVPELAMHGIARARADIGLPSHPPIAGAIDRQTRLVVGM